MRKLLTMLMFICLFILSMVSIAMAKDECKVMLNGSYIVFTNETPQNIDGHVVLPFRTILEKLGATVDWNAGTKTVNAIKDNKKISFTVGDSLLKIDENGTITTMNMDVAPFIDNGRTYAGTRFLAEALGYNVGWDAAEKTVVVIDPKTLFANADKDFSLLMSAIGRTNGNLEDTYKISGNYDANVIFGTEEEDNIYLKGTMDGLCKGLDSNINTAMTVNAFGEDQDFDMQIIVNNTDAAYIKGLGETLGLDKDVWMKSELDIDFSNLQGQFDLSELATLFLEDMDLTVNTYSEAETIYNIVNGIIGDKVFKVNKEGTVHTANINGVTVVNAMIRNAKFSNLLSMAPQGFDKLREQLSGIDITVTITDKDNGPSDFSLKFVYDGDEISAEADFIQTGDIATDLKLKANYEGNIDVDGNLHFDYYITDEVINVQLPDNAKVVDNSDFSATSIASDYEDSSDYEELDVYEEPEESNQVEEAA